MAFYKRQVTYQNYATSPNIACIHVYDNLFWTDKRFNHCPFRGDENVSANKAEGSAVWEEQVCESAETLTKLMLVSHNRPEDKWPT